MLASILQRCQPPSFHLDCPFPLAELSTLAATLNDHRESSVAEVIPYKKTVPPPTRKKTQLITQLHGQHELVE